MPNAAGIGALAAGLGTGYMLGEDLRMKQAKESREERQAKQIEEIRGIGIGRMKAEQPVLDKELELRGLKADYDAEESKFKTSLQPTDQKTRRVQADTAATTADTAATDAQGNLLDSHMRQSSNVWRAFKLGDKSLALKMLNGSGIVAPGQEFSDLKLEDVDVDKGDGTKVKVPTLTLVPKNDGDKPKRISVSMLDRLEQQYGSQYKVVDKSLVRINRDGSVQPLYEPDQFMAVPEGSTVASRRTGAASAAAGGINNPPGPASRSTARIDDRVKMAIDKVILPKFGGKFEGGVFFPDEANKDVAVRATALAGEKVRQGMDPEKAGAEAVAQAEREKALKDTTDKDKSAGAGGYSGPAPWRK